MSEPNCPKCDANYTYADGNMWVCPQCAHEWSQFESKSDSEDESSDTTVKDVHGNILQDGDTVVLIKELKVKGSSSAIKIGTKVKNIRLQDQGDGHNIACRIDGFGAMNLKSEFVKKA